MKYRIPEQSPAAERCLECGEVYYGRPNQKFCCESCKNRYNNRRTQSSRNARLRINTILEHNYSILSELVRNNRFSVSVVELSVLGYDLDYVTFNSRINRHDHCGCYDISFVRTTTRIYNIRKVEYDKNYTFVP